jgi:tRNA pseudouridine-54 N-methylase
MTQKITVDLNIFDDDGNVVDGTTSEMTLEQISDVVDHASQLILLHRDGKDISDILDELDEALTASGVLQEADAGPRL